MNFQLQQQNEVYANKNTWCDDTAVVVLWKKVKAVSIFSVTLAVSLNYYFDYDEH
jgi:hypothetical protein